MKAQHQIAVLIAVLISFLASGVAQSKSTKAEEELLRAVNQERKAHGLPALRSDEALAIAARKHAEHMAQEGRVAHQFPGEPGLPARARAAGARFRWLSENVDEGPNAAAIHQSFMKSPQHRANILDSDMDSAGVGVAERQGELFAVEDFSKDKIAIESRGAADLRVQNPRNKLETLNLFGIWSVRLILRRANPNAIGCLKGLQIACNRCKR